MIETQPLYRIASSPNRMVPSNIEMEQAALGSLMIDPDALYDIGAFNPEAFYLEKHTWIYRAISELHYANQPVDFLTIVNKLETNGKLAEVGGAAYITALANCVPTAVHAKTYFDIVLKTYAQRRLISAGCEIAGIGYEPTDKTPQEMLASASCALMSAEVYNDNRNSGKSMDDAMAEFGVELMDYAESKRAVWGIATGLDLDKYLGGLHKQELLVISGDPGIGKTALVLEMAMRVSANHTRAALFSLEMSQRELNLRMVSNHARINGTLIKRGMLDERCEDRVLASANALREYSLTTFCESESTASIRSRVARLKRTCGLEVVFVDYSKLLMNEDRQDNESLRMGNAARDLKNTARDFDVSMVLVHPVNRNASAQNRRPELADMGWSWDVVYHADTILFAWKDREKHANDKIINLYAAKNRNGAIIDFDMVFDNEIVKWENAAK